MKLLPNAITTCIHNWLASRSRTGLLLLAGVVAGALACEQPKEIGLPPLNPVDVAYSDTLSVIRQTVRFDSVRSSDVGSMLVGRYTDPTFGLIQARAFVQSRLASDFVVTDTLTGAVTAANRIIQDSTRLVLDLGGAYYGDTTRLQEIRVFRLTDSLRLGVTYDISSSISAESQPLAQQTIRPRPTARDSINARFVLPASFGREILALANTDAGKVANLNLFRTQFRPDLLITANSSDPSAILSYSAGVVSNGLIYGSYVAVYYHVEGEKRSRAQFLLLNGKRFNQITADRNSTLLANLMTGQSLPAPATNGRTFVQPGTGISTKLTFPGLDQIRKNVRVAINRATLIITPKTPSSATLFSPYYLTLSEIGPRNNLLRTSPNHVAQLLPQPQLLFDRSESSWVAAPQIAVYESRTKSYSFEMGGYFQSIISGQTPNNGLVLLTPSTNALTSLAEQTLYLNDRIFQMVLDGNASARLVVFYTSSK